MGQIAKMLSERSQGSLPGNTEINPREQLKAVTPRSGRELQVDKCRKSTVAVNEKKITDKNPAPTENDKSSSLEVPINETEKIRAPVVQPYKPPLPYLARLRKDRD